MSVDTQAKEPEQANIGEMTEALVHGLVRRLYWLLSEEPGSYELQEIEALSAALTAVMAVRNNRL